MADNHLEQPLRQAVEFLERAGYRYSIIGGIALARWGIIRTTLNIDIKVLVPDSDFSTAREKILAAFPEQAGLHLMENPLIVSIETAGVVIDFLLALPGYEVLIVDRSTPYDMGGWTVRVCSAEDLIIQKVVAGRGKDWSDIEGLLLEQWGKLDESYIEEWLGQFAEALDKPELLISYHQIHQKISKLI